MYGLQWFFFPQPYVWLYTVRQSAMADTATVATTNDESTTVPPPVPSETEKTEETEKVDSGEKKYSADELGKHNTEESCWVSIEGVVYDLTKVRAHSQTIIWKWHTNIGKVSLLLLCSTCNILGSLFLQRCHSITSSAQSQSVSSCTFDVSWPLLCFVVSWWPPRRWRNYCRGFWPWCNRRFWGHWALWWCDSNAPPIQNRATGGERSSNLCCRGLWSHVCDAHTWYRLMIAWWASVFENTSPKRLKIQTFHKF